MSINCPKMAVVSNINKKKDILFGKQSDQLACQMKLDEWKKIEILAKEYGLVGYDRDWKYVRDVLWQNLKRATVKKFENAKITGSVDKFTDTDNIVLEIIGIGKESLMLNGTNNDSSDNVIIKNEIDTFSVNHDLTNSPDANPLIEIQDSNSIVYSVGNCSSNKSVKLKEKMKEEKLQNKDEETDDELIELKKKHLKLEIYNLKLDALKKERLLNLPVSEFTKDIIRDGNKNDCYSSPFIENN